MADPVLGWAFVGVGMLAQGVAGVLLRRSLRQLASGARVQGRVVDNVAAMVESSKGAPRRFHFPVLEVDSGRGEPVRFQSKTGRGVPLPVGQSLPVIFDAAYPSLAAEATFRSLWLFPLLTCLAGLPFLLAGLSVLL